MTELERLLDKAAWSVPEGWAAERFARCRTCNEAVLWCRSGQMGWRVMFDRDTSEHKTTCSGVRRQFVGRTYKGQHGGKRDWGTRE